MQQQEEGQCQALDGFSPQSPTDEFSTLVAIRQQLAKRKAGAQVAAAPLHASDRCLQVLLGARMLQAEVAKQMLLQEEQQLSEHQATLRAHLHRPVQPSLEYSPEEVFAWGGAFEKIAAERHNLSALLDQPADKVLQP